MVNNIVQFIFRPIWNFVDLAIYLGVLLLIPHIGLWAFAVAVVLTILNEKYEKQLGWEVYDSSKD